MVYCALLRRMMSRDWKRHRQSAAERRAHRIELRAAPERMIRYPRRPRGQAVLP